MSNIQGEPGRPGAEGRPGSEGRAGTEGRPGATGEAGLPGHDGAAGVAGATGSAGAAGSPGATGATGDRGTAGKPPYRRMMVVFLFTVLAFSLLSYRLTENTRAVARVTLIACDRSNANSAQINNFLDILIKFTQKSDLLDASEKRDRVHSYESAKVLPLQCR